MTGGAATVAPRLCNKAGCAGPVVGRGMCDLHYRRWRRANPGITMMAVTRQTVLNAMPATIPKIIEKTGLCRETVLRALEALTVPGLERQAYIYDWEPPAGKGKNWQAIYRQGFGKDKALTKKRKAEHSRAMELAWLAKHRPTLRQPEPPPAASWFAALELAA